MRVFRVLYGNDTDGQMMLCDAIKYEDALWLVPEWLPDPQQPVMRPARIVRLDQSQIQETPGFAGDYLAKQPVPKAAIDGKTTGIFRVIEHPEIEVPMGRA